jgi:hypothetical protein
MTKTSERQQAEKRWTDYAKMNLVGKKIVSVRYLSTEEAYAMGWSNRPLVIQFDDDSIIYSSMDDEGNNGGAILGQSKDGKQQLAFPVL